MSELPLVSIVIPVYNGANYAGEAIESALSQRYRNLEVIVVNDGSTDGGATRAVVRSFEPHIRYIEKPNGGVASALNAGIAAMRGRFFSWLSHDDQYKRDKVACQVDAARDFGSRCVVIGDFELMNSQGDLLHRVSLAGHNLIGRPLDAVFCGLINGCALLVPRDLFDDVGQFEPGLPTTQDYHLWYRMARLVPFVHCPHAGVRQRVHSLQGSRHSSHLDEASRMFSYLIDSTPPELMRAYDGSEVRFLMRVRSILTAYPGLQAYLDFRIGDLLQHTRYSVALCSGTEGAGAEAAREQLKCMRPAPTDIVTIDIPSNGRPTAIRDRMEAAFHRTSAETIVFLPAEDLPQETELMARLQYFIGSGSDILRPKVQSSGTAVLSHVIARRGVLPALGEAFANERLIWREMPSHLHVTDYSPSDPPADAAQALLQAPDGKRSPHRGVTQLAAKLLTRAVVETRKGGSLLGRTLSLAVPTNRITAALQGNARYSFLRGTAEGAVAEALVSLLQPELPAILYLSHALGGGAHRHLSELTTALRGKANCITGYGQRGGLIHLCVESGSSQNGVVFRLPEHQKALGRILRQAGVTRVDVHHTLGFDQEAELLLEELGVPFDVTLVDYHLISTNPHLCFEDGSFVGDDRLQGSDCGMLRPAPLPILSKASRVITICRDMGARMQRLCPELPLVAARHWREASAGRVRHVFVPRLWGNEPLRVVIAGWIVESKGRCLIQDAARMVVRRRLPIRLHVLGQMDVPAAEWDECAGALTVHGRYESEQFSERLGAIAPHLAWLPTQVPETWSYVLSDLIESALPVAATAIGAIPERCHGRPATWLLPWESSAGDWIDLFLTLHGTRLREPPRWTSIDDLPAARNLYFDEYLQPAVVWRRRGESLCSE